MGWGERSRDERETIGMKNQRIRDRGKGVASERNKEGEGMHEECVK